MSDNFAAGLSPSIVKTSITLGLFALIAALLLGVVNLSTADRIQQQELAAERRALEEVLPGAFHNNDLLSASLLLSPADDNYVQAELLGLTVARQIYIARQDNNFSGIIVPVEAHDGYSGDIILLVGILADGTLSGVRVLSHKETPGLGDKIEPDISSWIFAFEGKSLESPPLPQWQVIKDGGQFDQLAGATITPRAVVNAVKRALQFFQLNRSKLETLQFSDE